MRFLVFGAGLMGGAAAFDLARGEGVEEVLLADADLAIAEQAAAQAKSEGSAPLRGIQLDASDPEAVEKALEGVDAALSAVPYFYNLGLAQAAIRTGTHFCDLGGNNSVVDATLKLDPEAKKAGVSLVPDCGLAPGQVAVQVRSQVDAFDSVESVKIRVGGLPKHPEGALEYQKVFSVHGLINEYIEPVRALRDGELVTLEPLSEIETLHFPPPYETLEAFTTSGGTSTLVETMRDRVPNLDYKTIRYPGHGHVFRSMYEMGFFDSKPILVGGLEVSPRDLSHELLDARLPSGGPDLVLILVETVGEREGKRMRLKYQGVFEPNSHGHTAMMQTTAYSAAIVCRMMADGRIPAGGARPQELCVPPEAFLEELDARGIAPTQSWEELGSSGT